MRGVIRLVTLIVSGLTVNLKYFLYILSVVFDLSKVYK